MARFANILQRVKAHPGIADSEVGKLADDDFAFVVAQLIPPVIQQLSGSAGMDPGQRHYTFSDPLTVTAALDGAGIADLTALIADGLLLERLKFGEITHPSSDFPLVLQAHTGQGILPSNYDSFGFLHCWLVGPKLHTRSADANQTPLPGSLAFACPRVAGLDDLSSQLDDDLISNLVMRLRGGTPSPPAQVVSQ
jgi:hypothetical protein